MKLSEAIREGYKAFPYPYKDKMFIFELARADIRGLIFAGTVMLLDKSNGRYSYFTLAGARHRVHVAFCEISSVRVYLDNWYKLDKQIRHPRRFKYMPLMDILYDLWDNWKWSAEKIANWLESIGE